MLCPRCHLDHLYCWPSGEEGEPKDLPLTKFQDDFRKQLGKIATDGRVAMLQKMFTELNQELQWYVVYPPLSDQAADGTREFLKSKIYEVVDRLYWLNSEISKLGQPTEE